jgi:hypothetical protein
MELLRTCECSEKNDPVFVLKLFYSAYAKFKSTASWILGWLCFVQVQARAGFCSNFQILLPGAILGLYASDVPTLLHVRSRVWHALRYAMLFHSDRHL